MKKFKRIFFVLLLFLPLLAGSFGLNAFAEEEINLSDTQKNIIMDHCDTMKDNLKSLQKVDSRTRVYLGRYYETILTNFITPLNLRLVENNISNTKLLDNQTNFAAKRNNFVSDFIVYQQALEELINVNCKAEPTRFYEKLLSAREKRKTVNKDVSKLKAMTDEQKKLVEELKNGQ